MTGIACKKFQNSATAQLFLNWIKLVHKLQFLSSDNLVRNMEALETIW
jgi:hypothetical protein